MVKILFVCHGNICRSPMAELVLRDMAKKRGIPVEVASAAVSREELGNPVYPPAARVLRQHGIDPAGKYARQITGEDCRYYDRIYYMDCRNRHYLQRMFPGETKLLPFLPRDVADPWYSGDFTRTWADIQEGCSRILEEIANG